MAVPEPWGKQLQDYRASLGDVTAPGIPTHITLMPPFAVDGDELSVVEKHLADAAAKNEPFRIHLRGTGTFRPVSPVVFVAVAEGISQCEQLESAVRSGPLETELKFPYHPHVTVAHHLEDRLLDRAFAELAHFECEFEADHFSLYVHADEVGWQPTHSFALGAG